MWAAYWRGARTAAACWTVVAILWLAAGAFGFIFAMASGFWLGEALEGSLATRTLLKQLDANVLVDLYYHHFEGLRLLAWIAALLAAAHTALWWWWHAVVILAVQPEGDNGDLWRRGLAFAPRMAQLFSIALVALLAMTAAVAGPAYALMRWTRADPSPFIWQQIGAAALAAWSLAYVFLVAVHDHARIRAVRNRQGALLAYRWALGFVLGGGERALPLAVLLQATALLLWATYQAINLAFPTTALLGVTGSLAWGAVFIGLRVWLRVWFFAAQSRLQS